MPEKSVKNLTRYDNMRNNIIKRYRLLFPPELEIPAKLCSSIIVVNSSGSNDDK